MAIERRVRETGRSHAEIKAERDALVPMGRMGDTGSPGSVHCHLEMEPDRFRQYIRDIDQVSAHWLERIGHFFEHYKDLEKEKWVRLAGWGNTSEAKQILVEAMQRFNAMPEGQKPNF